MKQALIAAVLFVAAVVQAQSAKIYLVTDLSGQFSQYQLLTSEEERTLQKEIAEETKELPAILNECEKTWKEVPKGPKFPKTAIKPRKMVAKSPAMNKEIAEAKMEKMAQKLMEETFERVGKEEEMVKKMKAADMLIYSTKASLKDRALEEVAAKLGAKLNRKIPSYKPVIEKRKH